MAFVTRLKVVAIALVWAAAAAAQADHLPDFSNAAKARAVNYVRPGWFIVDGRWARPQATYPSEDLVSLDLGSNHDRLLTRNSPRIEPLLRAWRTSLIQLQGNPFGWKLSCPGRVWNDTHATGTQNLSLIATADNTSLSDRPLLTKIEITPQRQVVQAIRKDADALLSIIVVFGGNFVEATIGPFNAAPKTLMRSTSLRQLMIDRPTEMRRDVIPVLKLVNQGENPLAPAAGDVYRVFTHLPVEPTTQAAIEHLIPRLTARDANDRRKASDALKTLGRRGVQAAMRMNLSELPPEAADRISAFIADNTRDPRSVEALRHDASFLFDCMDDPDPNVRAEAGANVGK